MLRNDDPWESAESCSMREEQELGTRGKGAACVKTRGEQLLEQEEQGTREGHL